MHSTIEIDGTEHHVHTEAGSVYGHPTTTCDAAGCSGEDRYLERVVLGSTKKDVVTELGNRLGSEGTRAQAEALYEMLEVSSTETGALYLVLPAEEKEWHKLVDQAAEATQYTLRYMDGSGVVSELDADDDAAALEAAEEDIRSGDWDTSEGTIWVKGMVYRGEEEVDSVTVTIEAEEPACRDERTEHEWCSPHELVGGLKENPGVVGHGGGIISTEICEHCGCSRVTDTWAQNPETGEQGLTSVRYDKTEHHEAWLSWRLSNVAKELKSAAIDACGTSVAAAYDEDDRELRLDAAALDDAERASLEEAIKTADVWDGATVDTAWRKSELVVSLS